MVKDGKRSANLLSRTLLTTTSSKRIHSQITKATMVFPPKWHWFTCAQGYHVFPAKTTLGHMRVESPTFSPLNDVGRHARTLTTSFLQKLVQWLTRAKGYQVFSRQNGTAPQARTLLLLVDHIPVLESKGLY